ncbi:MAG: hypothetical protein JSV33_02650 [bacterium]|nr:MAG: hypothetical protein JSV33_02650 [bacterium]
MEQLETRRESTVKDFLEVIFRRKWIVLGIVAVASCVVLVLNVREPATYESMAKMLLKRGETAGVFSMSVRTLTWEEDISSQIEMLKSMVIIDRAQELLPRFYPEGYEKRGFINPGNVNAGVVATSNVLWVTYTSREPVFCEAAVNGIVNAYREHYQEVRTPPEMEDFFLEELQSIKEEIDYWRSRKERVEKEWGIIDIEQQRSSTLQRLDNYQGELDRVLRERREKEALTGKLRKFRELDIEEQSTLLTGLIVGVRQDDVLRTLRNRLVDLKIEESKLEQNLTDEHKDLVRIREQIERVYDLLDREIEAAIIIQESELEILRLRQDTFEELVRPLEALKQTYPEKEVELERITVALARLESNYDDLVEQHMTSKISIASNPEWTVTILNPATKAYRKKTRDYVRMALGPLFSLIIALGFAFFIDNLDHSIKNVSEAEETLGIQVLASMPEAKQKW